MTPSDQAHGGSHGGSGHGKGRPKGSGQRSGGQGRRNGQQARSGSQGGYSSKGENRSQRNAAQRRPAGSRDSRQSRGPRPPAIPDDVTLDMLDDVSIAALKTLGAVHEEVGRHIVAAGLYLDDDPKRALEHARAARAKGARVGLVREVAGLAAYRAGSYQEARRELQAARRMTGAADLLPLLADCERALGRPEEALALVRDPAAKTLEPDGVAELVIVAAGALRDLDRADDAVSLLGNRPEISETRVRPHSARLWYAYADALRDAGKLTEARRWFQQVASVDEMHETDAAQRLARPDLAPESETLSP